MLRSLLQIRLRWNRNYFASWIWIQILNSKLRILVRLWNYVAFIKELEKFKKKVQYFCYNLGTYLTTYFFHWANQFPGRIRFLPDP
jgi:hypothetical protein